MKISNKKEGVGKYLAIFSSILFVTNYSFAANTNTTLCGTLTVTGNATVGGVTTLSGGVAGTLTVNSVSLPATTSSTVGVIDLNGNSFAHSFGTNNTFYGQNAGNFTIANANGGNTGIGFNALNAAGNSEFNTGVGANSLATNTDGWFNTAVGYNTLTSLNHVNDNVAVGYLALSTLASGGQHTAIGSGALQNSRAGFVSHAGNTAVGYHSLSTVTTGTQNTAVGAEALTACGSTSSANTVIGFQAGNALTSGNNNLFIGNQAGSALTSGSNNIDIGTVGSNGDNGVMRIGTPGTHNFAVISGITGITNSGKAVFCDSNGGLGTNVSNNNISIGQNAGNNTVNTNTDNVAVGVSALAAVTNAKENVAIGSNALAAATQPFFNVAVGYNALATLGTFDNNVALGTGAGSTLTTGNNNIFIGTNAGNNISSGSNNITIGYAGNGGDSGAIRIGTQGTHTLAAMTGITGATSASGVAVLINSNSIFGTTTSSIKYKHSINDLENCDILMDFRPVTFRYKPEYAEAQDLQFGLIAEEVNDIMPDLVLTDSLGAPQTVRYHFLTPLLIKGYQEQQKKIEAQEQSLLELTILIEALMDRIESLEKQS